MATRKVLRVEASPEPGADGRMRIFYEIETDNPSVGVCVAEWDGDKEWLFIGHAYNLREQPASFDSFGESICQEATSQLRAGVLAILEDAGPPLTAPEKRQ